MANRAPRPTTFAIQGQLARSDIGPLRAHARDVVETSSAAAVVGCDLGAATPDLVTIEALAVLQLESTRRGRRLRLQRASPELRDLLELVGLDDVLRE